VGADFSKASIAQKNNDRIAVNLRHTLASFWIDASSQEVKAARAGGGGCDDKIEVVAIAAKGYIIIDPRPR
jgi:hypothetical protein